MNIDRPMMTNHSGKSMVNKASVNILIRTSLGHSEVLRRTRAGQRFKSQRQSFKLKLFHDVIKGPFDFFETSGIH